MQSLPHLLAMAGAGEAAEAFAISLAWLGVLIASGTSFFAVFKKSHFLAVGALIVCFMVSVIFMPWQFFFMQLPANVASDPDVLDWLNAWRWLGAAWGVACLLTTIALVRCKRPQLGNNPSETS